MHLLPRPLSFQMIFFSVRGITSINNSKNITFLAFTTVAHLHFSENNPYINCMGPLKLNFSCKFLFMHQSSQKHILRVLGRFKKVSLRIFLVFCTFISIIVIFRFFFEKIKKSLRETFFKSF